MPYRVKPACPICRRVVCEHRNISRVGAYRNRALERTHCREAVEAWVGVHGYWCPGYGVPAHESHDLTADHVVPVGLGGDPLGEVQVLCRACNSRRGRDMQGEARGFG